MCALVLTGAPGAGKTTTLTALMGRLEAAGARFAAVEVEALALVHPWADDDAAFEHLAFVAASFARRGYRLLLASATVRGPAYLACAPRWQPTTFCSSRSLRRPRSCGVASPSASRRTGSACCGCLRRRPRSARPRGRCPAPTSCSTRTSLGLARS